MISSKGYAAQSSKDLLKEFNFERRELNENDILIDIQFCGVCHSDIHQVKNEWGHSLYPVVPGHEIVGTVKKIGTGVKKFQVGDIVGVGCMVDSCQKCSSCEEDLEQYCEEGNTQTYNSELDDGSHTYGGYSNNIVVREEFVLRIPENLNLAATAPLLCAGITTYSPINHHNMGKGHKVGVVGLGGLGHMALKIAKAKGCQVIVFTTSPSKKEDAFKLGADGVILSKDESEMEKMHNKLDFIINTVAAPHKLADYSTCLKRDGTMILVGLPDKPHPELEVGDLICSRKAIAGSLIGGIKETQEMLDFCSEHNIVCDIEMIDIKDINEAYERIIKGDVKYRFVIDVKSL